MLAQSEEDDIWVQLLSVANLDLDGIQRTYQPGDWVNVGRQTALAWFASGQARGADGAKVHLAPDCGFAIDGGETGRITSRVSSLGIDAPATAFNWTIPYERTLVWSAGHIVPRPDLLLAGFDLLRRWELAAPLISYTVLACDVGSAVERSDTAEVVRELRVPLYEPGLVFLRRSPGADAVLARWRTERESGVEPHHALLRALYAAKPLLHALPVSWVARRGT